jgi:hypothetical protein
MLPELFWPSSFAGKVEFALSSKTSGIVFDNMSKTSGVVILLENVKKKTSDYSVKIS